MKYINHRGYEINEREYNLLLHVGRDRFWTYLQDREVWKLQDTVPALGARHYNGKDEWMELMALANGEEDE